MKVKERGWLLLSLWLFLVSHSLGPSVFVAEATAEGNHSYFWGSIAFITAASTAAFAVYSISQITTK
jgi:hypothetical protein